MFEPMTIRAQKAMALARQEALRSQVEYAGGEHVLLGVLAEGTGVGASVLVSLGLTSPNGWHETDKLTLFGPRGKGSREGRRKAELTDILKQARIEARHLGHNYIGTEHLLLGLLRDHESAAGRLLRSMDVTYALARQQIVDMLGENGGRRTSNLLANHRTGFRGLGH